MLSAKLIYSIASSHIINNKYVIKGLLFFENYFNVHPAVYVDQAILFGYVYNFY